MQRLGYNTVCSWESRKAGPAVTCLQGHIVAQASCPWPAFGERQGQDTKCYVAPFAQFSTRSPWTCLNSHSLLVTRTSRRDFACAASSRFVGPMGLPLASSRERIRPYSAEASAQDSGQPQGEGDQAHGEARPGPHTAFVQEYCHEAYRKGHRGTEHDQDPSKESEERASAETRKTQQGCRNIEPGQHGQPEANLPHCTGPHPLIFRESRGRHTRCSVDSFQTAGRPRPQSVLLPSLVGTPFPVMIARSVCAGQAEDNAFRRHYRPEDHTLWPISA
jgi:hypothetical protein